MYCVRHGEAFSSAEDPSCQLTPRGQRQVANIAHHLAQSRVQIPVIIHSGKPRAQQTAAIFAEALQVSQVTTEPRLLDCEADVADLLALIPTWTEDTLLVGHLPYMPRLINALVLGKPDLNPIIHYAPATVVCLEQQSRSRWIIRWVMTPDLFP